jgi:putative ABC transport system permease protein
LGIARFVGPALHMIVRELERRPLRTLASSFAVAASVGLMVIGGWYYDGIDELMHTQFFEVMREDVAVTFIVPRPERAVRDLSHIPGVLDAEGLRMVPVRFRSGPYKRDGAITGYYDDMQMRGLRDRYGKPVPLPPDGVVLTDILAEILHVKVGDRIEVEVHDGERGTHEVTVTGLVDESFGLQGHMRIDRLRSWLGEPRVVSMGLLRIDPNESEVVNARLKEMPFVLSVTQRSEILARFEEQSGSMILTMAFIITLFAATITVGVVYNNARVALSLRARDLASLRVLGFRRSEISAILLGEQAIQVLLGLPVGLVLGKLMVYAIASTLDPETYRLPIILTMKSYAFAAVIAIAAAALSALMVRRKLDKLDLISVLKTRE